MRAGEPSLRAPAAASNDAADENYRVSSVISTISNNIWKTSNNAKHFSCTLLLYLTFRSGADVAAARRPIADRGQSVSRPGLKQRRRSLLSVHSICPAAARLRRRFDRARASNSCAPRTPIAAPTAADGGAKTRRRLSMIVSASLQSQLINLNAQRFVNHSALINPLSHKSRLCCIRRTYLFRKPEVVNMSIALTPVNRWCIPCWPPTIQHER